MSTDPKASPSKANKKHTATEDRNFDDLASRFRRNVYGDLKGDIRLAVLDRDLREQLPAEFFTATRPWRILDAGGGQGQFSLALARLGHQVVLCDISAEMLKLARENCAAAGVEDRVQLYHGSIQNFAAGNSEPFDLVLCHAVLEWVVEPQELLQLLLEQLKPAGYLSLTFYNVTSIKMKNLLRTNFQKVLAGDFQGARGSLTPTFPREPADVYHWLAPLPLRQLCCSGIRCFHDYILDAAQRAREPQQQVALELQLSREEPWRSLARYIHVLSQKHAG